MPVENRGSILAMDGERRHARPAIMRRRRGGDGVFSTLLHQVYGTRGVLSLLGWMLQCFGGELT